MDDPLSVCCRHLANSQTIIEGKNAEIERLRLTDEEREAIERACDEGRWYPADYHHVRTLLGLLRRLG